MSVSAIGRRFESSSRLGISQEVAPCASPDFGPSVSCPGIALRATPWSEKRTPTGFRIPARGWTAGTTPGTHEKKMSRACGAGTALQAPPTTDSRVLAFVAGSEVGSGRLRTAPQLPDQAPLVARWAKQGVSERSDLCLPAIARRAAAGEGARVKAASGPNSRESKRRFGENTLSIDLASHQPFPHADGLLLPPTCSKCSSLASGVSNSRASSILSRISCNRPSSKTLSE